jgi:hypothetical protein
MSGRSRSNSEVLRGYQEANADLRAENERINQQLANITQQLTIVIGQKSAVMQENDLLRNTITEMQIGIETEREHMRREFANKLHLARMSSQRFGSNRRKTGGCKKCGCGSTRKKKK